MEACMEAVLQSNGYPCVCVGAKRRLQHIMTLATGIGNYGNLPIAIISSLCDDSTGPIGSLFPSSVRTLDGVMLVRDP